MPDGTVRAHASCQIGVNLRKMKQPCHLRIRLGSRNRVDCLVSDLARSLFRSGRLFRFLRFGFVLRADSSNVHQPDRKERYNKVNDRFHSRLVVNVMQFIRICALTAA